MNVTTISDITPGFDSTSVVRGSDLRSIAAVGALACVHPQGIAMGKSENRWAYTPKFGTTYHFQRWKVHTT